MSPPKTTPDTRVVELNVNDQAREVAGPPDEILLHALRDRLGLTGTKAVCEMGNCGACTVVLDGEAVYSCLVLTAECEGRDVETIEGVADGPELDPVQEAFVDHDALQCGYCTPGQVMSLVGLRRRVSAPSDEEIADAVVGNLCRCGAYRHILEAARQALGTDAR